LQLKSALVVATGKNLAWVSLDGEAVTRVAQLRRMTGKRSMPVPGDVVHVRVLEDGRAVVDRIEPRRFALERRTAIGRSKTMAANVDLLVTVTALADPPPRLVTLDQLLAFAELENVAAAVVLTKPDLVAPDQSDGLSALYRGLGYAVVVVAPKTGSNVEAMRELLAGHHGLLTGVSGVGKSTLFRALGGEGSVGEVSRHGLGRQTTTTARLCRFPEGGFLIDSPGVNEFGLGSIEAGELAGAFREMRALAGRCRFTDCSHLREPGCAVREAVDSGAIAASRYASYRKMLEEPT
jgi:ribosome biogenesis GTPase